MEDNKQANRIETRNVFIGCLAALLLGAGTAGAAITVGPEKHDNPAARPLTITRGVTAARAYGPDDEDCVRIVKKTVMPDGKIRVTRNIECAQ